ncbi:MAG: lipopolysaccharide heptosyltransferase II [Methylophilaceae bacterium]|nr:lipopolysaccharide heptosyltransferase II [Methylophilaceae bacterium]
MSSGAILVIGPSWVGDMILAQSLFKTLKQRKPDVPIDVAAPAWALPLLERMPEVRCAIPLPFRHGRLDLAARIRIGLELRHERYAQAILLPNSFKSALIPFFAGIPKRTGYRGELRYGLLNDIRRLDARALPMTVQRFVALGLDAGEALPDMLPRPRLTVSAEQAARVLAGLKKALPQQPVLGLCPGAEYGPAKRWPEAYYAEVAKWALAHGWQVWLFGSAKDAGITAKIDALTGNRCLDLGGKTSLGEAIDLMALTDAVVSNDTGLMHLAAALNKPLVAIFGSSDPHHTPPMNEHARILHLGLECSPCFARTCPLGHLDCLNGISPDQVEQLLQCLPEASKA